MRQLVRHTRGLFVAVCSLALTAGVAFAGGSLPTAAGDGLAIAAEAAGRTVPAVPEVDTPDVEEPDTDEPEEAEQAEETETDDPADDSHGALVSAAARMDTPGDFDNHGDFVSCVAGSAHGEGDTPFDLTTITKAACDAAKPDKPDNAGKPENAGRPESAGKRETAGPTGTGATRSAAGKARGGH